MCASAYYVNNNNNAIRGCRKLVTNAVSASIRAQRKVDQLGEFCPRREKLSFEIPLAILMCFSAVGHFRSEMLNANPSSILFYSLKSDITTGYRSLRVSH